VLKRVQHNINLEHLLTVPAQKLTAHRESSAGFEIYEHQGVRWIRFPDASIQSVMLLEEPAYPLLSYVQGLLSTLLFLPTPAKVLNLGLGSGSIERFILSQLPELQLVSVETDARLIELTKQHFCIPSSHTVIKMPAQDYLQSNQQSFDILLSDVYSTQGGVNSYLTSEFIQNAVHALDQDGVFAINLLPESRAEVVEVLFRIRTVFPHIQIYDVPDMHNLILFCTISSPPTPDMLMQRAKQLRDSTGLDLSPICGELIRLPAKE
jgi:spermidine synthase